MKEKIKQMLLKDKSMTLLIVAAVLILLIGGSYAWFTLTTNGSKTNIIKAGSLTLTLDESTTEGITISNAYPMTDSEGMSSDKNPPRYTFTLKNEGDIASNYVIYLEDEETTKDETTNQPRDRMDDSVVKYNLSKTEYDASGAAKGDPSTTLQLLENVKQDGKRVLDSGVIEPNEHIEYTMKTWMSYNAGNEYQNTSFNAKLNIEGTQVRIQK